ncbi:MAG: adenine phosphoribosyltransferase [Candidatus Thermoplasmatota archaeon]|nr:adenine phosphoribosyltransferase [Candidatus Thermoplasmatota archaeon]
MDMMRRIRRIPEFKGVVFWDITPLLRDGRVFCRCILTLAESFSEQDVKVVAANEARGFIIGAPIAHRLSAGFVPIRKRGKLPPSVRSLSYMKEYESDVIEIKDDSIDKGDTVLLVDDLLATGGTIKANADLVQGLGGVIIGMGFFIELGYLNPRANLRDYSCIHSLLDIRSTDEFCIEASNQTDSCQRIG